MFGTMFRNLILTGAALAFAGCSSTSTNDSSTQAATADGSVAKFSLTGGT